MGKTNLIGSWAFLIGVVLAVVLGVLSPISTIMAIVFVVLGLVIGLLNVTGSEMQPFMMAGTVLVLVAALGQTVFSVVPYVSQVLSAMLMIFVPATVIVALKSVFQIARR